MFFILKFLRFLIFKRFAIYIHIKFKCNELKIDY